MPSSRVIWTIGRPLVRTKSTASRLNSAVNWRRFLGSLPCGHPLKGGVLPLDSAGEFTQVTAPLGAVSGGRPSCRRVGCR
jgi:hypothetical protein